MAAPGHADTFEVAVIGGGPAGAIAALTLARRGRQVLLVDAGGERDRKYGESLPPVASALLAELGLVDAVAADALRSYGNQSAWGSEVLADTDFIRDPRGCGWHVNRSRFDAVLREAALGAGARGRDGSVGSVERGVTQGWRVGLVAGSRREVVESQWLVDASGRRAWLARKQRAVRRRDDRLVAFIAVYGPQESAADTDRDARTLVESVPDGWWYASLIPGDERVVVFLTDASAPVCRQARDAVGFAALLEDTRHIRARLAVRSERMLTTPRAVPAGSARLERFVGDGWLAAGDAALAFDPLSSQGIYTAMYAGLKGGAALDAALGGDHGPLVDYELRLGAVSDSYREQLASYYALEGRWPECAFWRARRSVRPGASQAPAA